MVCFFTQCKLNKTSRRDVFSTETALIADTEHTMPTTTKQIPELSQSDKERFRRKVDKNGPTMPHMDSACWIWTGHRDKDGYGTFTIRDRPYRCNRVALFLGEASIFVSSNHALHRCDNPPCCNPDHLFPGTNRDNDADSVKKGRRNRGESRHNSKLTAEQVIEIRRRHSLGGVLQRDLAVEYRVDQTLISVVVLRKRWKHVA